jgi:hypothetical protein
MNLTAWPHRPEGQPPVSRHDEFWSQTAEQDSFKIMDHSLTDSTSLIRPMSMAGRRAKGSPSRSSGAGWRGEVAAGKDRAGDQVYGNMGDWPSNPSIGLSYQRACEESLRRMQTDHIDLYQIPCEPPHSLGGNLAGDGTVGA